jgi:lipopolysaccharide transport system ATP-binding protein
MEEVTKKEERTILFVSHNMAAIQQLCVKSILLKNGRIQMIGPTHEVIETYLKTTKPKSVIEYQNPQGVDKAVLIRKIRILNKENTPSTQIPINENLFIEIEYQINKEIKDALLSVVFNFDGDMLLVSSTADSDGNLTDFKPGVYITKIEVPKFLFNVGQISCDIAITKQKPFLEFLDREQDISFEITNINNPRAQVFDGKNFGKISSVLNYETKII